MINKVPEAVKRVAEYTLCALLGALANWGVEEIKASVKARREAAQKARTDAETIPVDTDQGKETDNENTRMQK